MGGAFARQYTGSNVITYQIGATTAADQANAMAGDVSGGMWIAGTTSSGIADDGLGITDGFVRRYKAGSASPTTYQVGSAANETLTAIATDATGSGIASVRNFH